MLPENGRGVARRLGLIFAATLGGRNVAIITPLTGVAGLLGRAEFYGLPFPNHELHGRLLYGE